MTYHYCDLTYSRLQTYVRKRGDLNHDACMLMSESGLGDVDDMAELTDLNLGSIMHNCAVRFARDNIYVCSMVKFRLAAHRTLV